MPIPIARVRFVIGMVKSLVAAKHATERLDERALEEAVALVRNQTAAVEYDFRHYYVGRATADIAIRITGVVAALELERGLNNRVLTFFPTAYVLADLDDLATHFVTDNDRVFGDVRGYALVRRALLDRLVGRSALRVGDYAHENLVVGYFGKFERFYS